jgi:hypothetical protein
VAKSNPTAIIAVIEQNKKSDPRRARLALLKSLTDELLEPHKRFDLIPILTRILYGEAADHMMTVEADDEPIAKAAPAKTGKRRHSPEYEKKIAARAAVAEAEKTAIYFSVTEFCRRASAGRQSVEKWCAKTNRNIQGKFSDTDIVTYRSYIRQKQLDIAAHARSVRFGTKKNGSADPAQPPPPKPSPPLAPSDDEFQISEQDAANLLGLGWELKAIQVKRMRGEMPPFRKRHGSVFYRKIDIESLKNSATIVKASNVTPISDARLGRAEETLRRLRGS